MDRDNKIIAGTCYSITRCKDGFGTRILRGFRPNWQSLGEVCGFTFSKLAFDGFFGGLGELQGPKMAFGKPQVFYIVYAETMERNNKKV
jgi:hypothetical protein